MKFIREVLELAEKIQPQDDALVAEFELEEGDKVVGELPMELRGLYAVLRTRGDELNELRNQILKQADALVKDLENKTIKQLEASRDELTKKIAGPARELDTIKDMFWSSVRRAFLELAVESNLRICKGWQVVIFTPDESPELLGGGVIAVPMSALREILGQP